MHLLELYNMANAPPPPGIPPPGAPYPDPPIEHYATIWQMLAAPFKRPRFWIAFAFMAAIAMAQGIRQGIQDHKVRRLRALREMEEYRATLGRGVANDDPPNY